MHTWNVINNQVYSSSLVHELDSPCQQHSIPSIDLVFAKDGDVGPESDVLAFKLNGILDCLHLLLNIWIVLTLIMDGTQRFDCFLSSPMVAKPTWGLGDAKDEEYDKQGKDQLESDWKTPCDWTSSVGHAKVEPVCEHDPNTNEEDFSRDQSSTFLTFAQFCLIPD